VVKVRFGDKGKSKSKGVMELNRSLSRKMRIIAMVLIAISCFGYGWIFSDCLSEARITKYYSAIRHLESANMKLEHELRQMQEVFKYSQKYGIDVGLAKLIYRVALKEGVKPELFFDLVQVESQFKQFAVSTAGAMGYTQMMYPTAKELEPGLENKAELFIPEMNLRLGARKLKQLLEMWQGNVALALLSYNRGENRVIEVSERGQNPDNGYPRMVMQ